MQLQNAAEFRTKGAALVRAKTDGFKGLYFGQCTTLSTRLRCEVSKRVIREVMPVYL